jgi:hypothetical protein
MRNRLTLILAAAVIALVVTSRTASVSPTDASAGAQGTDLVQTVPGNHWAYPALEQLRDGKTSVLPAPGSSGTKPVTRFEMAVLLSRIMEKLDQTVGGKLPAEKLELLDKLVKEFRSDLEGIGTDMSGMKGRLDELARKLDDSKPGTGPLVKQVFDANQKVDAVVVQVKEHDQRMASLVGKLNAQNAELAETRKKVKVYAEVLAKVLVKMARLEKSPAGSGAANVGLTRTNLSDIRDLIKDFAVDFERRLARVEEPSGVRIPAGTRMPTPTEATRRALADLDHIFDSPIEPEEPAIGPGGDRAESNSRSRLPDDSI